MSKVLIFDTECNSLDADNGFIMELAWGIYHVESKRLLSSKSSLIKWLQMYSVEVEAALVTGLSMGFCNACGTDAQEFFMEFIKDLACADYVCGHNAYTYDIPMVKSNLSRALPGMHTDASLNVHTIDTLLDCPYPSTQKSHALKYLAYDHGIILSNAHQAMADVEACAGLLFSYPWETVLAASNTPVLTINEKCEWGDQQKKKLLSRGRFYWNPTAKCYSRKIREYYLPELEKQLGFSLKGVVETSP